MADLDAAYFFHRFERAYRDGTDLDAAQGHLMRSIADAISEYGTISPSMRVTFQELRDTWSTDVPNTELLVGAKRSIWAELRVKNGDTHTIADAVDRTLRAMLCLVDLLGEDALETAGWAAEMLSTEPWPRHTKYF